MTDRQTCRQILETFRVRDKRVEIIHQPHLGYAAALNSGIHKASYDLVAMMDADDIMMPSRLERQLSFINAHPNASVICSYAYLIDINGRIIGTSQNSVDVEGGIAKSDPTLFSEIINPSALMRKTHIIQVGGYRESFISRLTETCGHDWQPLGIVLSVSRSFFSATDCTRRNFRTIDA